MSSNSLSNAERPLIGWALFMAPVIVFPFAPDVFGITLPFDILTFNLVSINVATYLAFRLLAFPKVEEISGTAPLRQQLLTLSLDTVPTRLGGKKIPEIFAISAIEQYSRAKVLIEVAEKEAHAIRRDWHLAMFGFLLTAAVASAIGFGEILKPLTPQKSAFLSISFATCVFHFWWPLFEARSRNH